MNQKTISQLKTISILYAEDEKNIREHIADTLRYYVKEVYEAKDGQEAYALYKSKQPDIILSDILMPIMDGIELVKRVREENEQIPIIMITAHTEKDYLLSAVKLHLEEYLVKPVNLENILRILKKCVKKIANHSNLEYSLPSGYSYEIGKKILSYKQRKIKLSKKEIKFFELLLCNQNRVVTYAELQEKVWGDDLMTDNALRSVVLSLRRKLPKNCITNLSGIGYKFEKKQ